MKILVKDDLTFVSTACFASDQWLKFDLKRFDPKIAERVILMAATESITDGSGDASIDIYPYVMRSVDDDETDAEFIDACQINEAAGGTASASRTLCSGTDPADRAYVYMIISSSLGLVGAIHAPVVAIKVVGTGTTPYSGGNVVLEMLGIGA